MSDYRAGDHEYRAFVGPFEQYDVIGAAQFALLYALGLRQRHRLLDVGCGSLRVGRMLITYLHRQPYRGSSTLAPVGETNTHSIRCG